MSEIIRRYNKIARLNESLHEEIVEFGLYLKHEQDKQRKGAEDKKE